MEMSELVDKSNEAYAERDNAQQNMIALKTAAEQERIRFEVGHSLTHSLTHSLAHSLTHRPRIHFIHSFIHPFIHSFTMHRIFFFLCYLAHVPFVSCLTLFLCASCLRRNGICLVFKSTNLGMKKKSWKAKRRTKRNIKQQARRWHEESQDQKKAWLIDGWMDGLVGW